MLNIPQHTFSSSGMLAKQDVMITAALSHTDYNSTTHVRHLTKPVVSKVSAPPDSEVQLGMCLDSRRACVAVRSHLHRANKDSF